MESEIIFKTSDIQGAALSASLPLQDDNLLENLVQVLHTKKFTTTKTYTADWSNTIDNVFSKLMFMGTGFAFGLVKTKLIAQFLDHMEFVHPDLNSHNESADSTEILSDENLKMVSLDFNYILGLILGKMSADNNLEFIFKIRALKEISTIRNLNHLLAPEPKTIFDNVTDLKMNGIDIEMSENIFDIQARSEYHIKKSRIDHHKNYYSVNAKFEFRTSGPIDFSKIVRESIDRINSLTKSIEVGYA